MSELFRLTARAAVDLLKRREISPLDLIDAALARHAAVDGTVNALPTLCAERARDHARRLSDGRAAGERDHPGWLAGLPIAIKDLTDVAGVRTTYGSALFADHVPARSDILVERLESRGGIVLAKSNTPEFGASGNTWNEVFGRTHNPWNPKRTAGGSSGGAAAALATGQVWLAHGTDLSGSLRQPASFCSVVGMRCGPGRVPRGPTALPFGVLSVHGPMARNVPDLALALDAMAGAHPADPLAFDDGSVRFLDWARRGPAPKRAAFSLDLGLVPVHAEVKRLTAAAARRFEDLGAVVDETCPDMTDAKELWHAFRAVQFLVDKGALADRHPMALRQEIMTTLERSAAIGAGELAAAERGRSALIQRMVAFFGRYDVLICPPVVVPPFSAETNYVLNVEGRPLADYLDYMALCYAVSLTACPAIVVPCGFTERGLPVGIQLVGPPRSEARLIGYAAAFERSTGIADKLPIEPRANGSAPSPPA